MSFLVVGINKQKTIGRTDDLVGIDQREVAINQSIKDDLPGSALRIRDEEAFSLYETETTYWPM